jgi:hypothetical protein
MAGLRVLLVAVALTPTLPTSRTPKPELPQTLPVTTMILRPRLISPTDVSVKWKTTGPAPISFKGDTDLGPPLAAKNLRFEVQSKHVRRNRIGSKATIVSAVIRSRAIGSKWSAWTKVPQSSNSIPDLEQVATLGTYKGGFYLVLWTLDLLSKDHTQLFVSPTGRDWKGLVAQGVNELAIIDGCEVSPDRTILVRYAQKPALELQQSSFARFALTGDQTNWRGCERVGKATVFTGTSVVSFFTDGSTAKVDIRGTDEGFTSFVSQGKAVVLGTHGSRSVLIWSADGLKWASSNLPVPAGSSPNRLTVFDAQLYVEGTNPSGRPWYFSTPLKNLR